MECSATMRKLRISLSAIEFSTMRVEFSAVQIQRNSAPYHNRLLATAIVNGAHAPRSYCIEIHCVLFSIAFSEMPRNKSTRKTFDARISVGRFFRCFFLYTLCFFLERFSTVSMKVDQVYRFFPRSVYTSVNADRRYENIRGNLTAWKT